MNMLTTVMEWNKEAGFMGFTDAQQHMFTLIIVIATVLLVVIMLWGAACVLLVGKKLVHSPAGRNRTSLAAVAREGRFFIVPLLLTGILRSCIGLLWSLLLIVPGIIYAIRTTFYTIIIVAEDISYRAALRQSIVLVRGHTWQVLWRLAVIFTVIYGPPNLLATLGYWVVGAYETGMLVMDAVDAALNAPATIIALLASVALYEELKSKA